MKRVSAVVYSRRGSGFVSVYHCSCLRPRLVSLSLHDWDVFIGISQVRYSLLFSSGMIMFLSCIFK